MDHMACTEAKEYRKILTTLACFSINGRVIPQKQSS